MCSENNPPIGYIDSPSQTEKPFRIKHTIKKPNFFVIDKISNEYITNHNKKYYKFLIKYEFKLIFNNDLLQRIHIKTNFYNNTDPITLKRYLLYQIHNFIDKGYEFSYIDEMNITTVNDKMYMTYDYYIKHPMSAVERKLNMIISKNPHLIKSLNRSHIHLLIRKYSYIR